MRAFAGAVVAATMVLASGTASAGPCDDAERGTYLSNVCWLIEEFSGGVWLAPKIVSVNERKCTVTVNKDYHGFAGDTVYFNRANPNDLELQRTSSRHICWNLRGDGVSGKGPGSGLASVCGLTIAHHRIYDAFDNLYAKFCRGEESEF